MSEAPQVNETVQAYDLFAKAAMSVEGVEGDYEKVELMAVSPKEYIGRMWKADSDEYDSIHFRLD